MSDITQVTAGDDEMANMAQRFFTKASDAIVQASRLAKVVEDLQGQVANLTARIDSVVAENEQLRSELGQVRAERDDYRSRLQTSETEHSQTKADFARHQEEAAKTLADTQSAAANALNELSAKYDRLDEAHISTMNMLAHTQRWLEEERAKTAALEKDLSEAEIKLEAIANIVAKPVTEQVEEAAPFTDPTSASSPASSEQSSSGTEQPRNDDGKFEAVPMAARDFSY
jgi:chromosome segregation ATPase